MRGNDQRNVSTGSATMIKVMSPQRLATDKNITDVFRRRRRGYIQTDKREEKGKGINE